MKIEGEGEGEDGGPQASEPKESPREGSHAAEDKAPPSPATHAILRFRLIEVK